MNTTATARAKEPASGPDRSGDNPPRRILVVEDDRYIRELSTAALIDSGYEVDVAGDGAAAWDALNAELYDLMITDNSMPKVSGVELLQKLHAARMTLPVIMATGTLPTDEFTRHPWLTPDASLLKPYTVEEMVNTVKRVLDTVYGSAAGSPHPPDNHPTIH